ncbi:hypothetical protein BJ322DRAFT_1017121 [Thelephora terrestris]|uniref:Uncharacterized protein n=1 Tax=Thelephora terrestris TaxID=56493 RepID=A0A9P6LB10_9AGAM|nr:hypothetical protein BJ322DRAFT_1017121 [Thelephora terrestris]
MRDDRTHETPIQVYQLYAGLLDKQLGQTEPLPSVSWNWLPVSATEYASPTRRQGSTSWVEGNRLPHRLDPRTQAMPSSRPLPSLRTTRGRKGIPGRWKWGGVTECMMPEPTAALQTERGIQQLVISVPGSKRKAANKMGVKFPDPRTQGSRKPRVGTGGVKPALSSVVVKSAVVSLRPSAYVGQTARSSACKTMIKIKTSIDCRAQMHLKRLLALPVKPKSASVWAFVESLMRWAIKQRCKYRLEPENCV